MRRYLLAMLLAITACSSPQVGIAESCRILDSSQWTPTDTRQELIGKIVDAAEAYTALAEQTDGEIHSDFVALSDTFTNFTGYMTNDSNVGYDEIISQVDVETVQQSGRTIAWREANCPQ